MSAYDQYLNSLAKEDQGKNQLVASLSEAATANPDEFANMVKLSRAAKVSVDAVADYKTEAQQAQYLGDVGLDRLWRDAPKTANFLTVPENAKLAKDDHENLTGIEGAFDWLKNRGRAIGAAIPKANAGLWGMAASPFELLGIDSVGGYLRDQQRTTNRMAKAWGPQDNPGWMTNAIDQGLTSAGQQLVTLPMAFLPGGQNAALTAMVAPVFGESYGKARDKGLTPAQSIQYGTQDAAAEWVFERYGLGNLVKNVKAGTGYGRTLVEFMLREVPSEMATTVVQSFNEYANVNPDKPVGEWAAQLPDELAQTVVATLVGGGAISTTAKAVDSAVRAVEKRAALAEESSAAADMIDNINRYAAASTLLQRDPQTFASFIEQATEDGPVPDVFINAQTLQQSGIAEQLAAVSPAVAEQLQVALETGGDIRIPVAEYATTIAPTEYAQSLIDNLKVEPEGMSRAEAQEYMQSGKAQELQNEVDRIIAEQDDDGAFKQSAEAVRSNLQTQLDTAARFTPEVNSAYASMVGNFYAVMAAKLGTTPEAMFARFPLQIGAESVAGQQFAQGGEESRGEVARNLARNLSERGVATLFQNQNAPRGSFNPASLQITLLKGADLSTFLHESGHFFLEVQTTIAEQLQKEAEVFGLDTLKPGEQQIVQDAKAMMTWFGLRDLAEWNALDFEEKRTYHEQFARGFEAYLFEGNSPSIEMQGMFQRFRAWLLSVYRDLKSLNIELTDEVRGVFDRLLATNEQITLAEQGRSMMPLFASAEQAGMTPEEFAAYQALGVDATNDAIQDLQARGLRDMQWMNNARGRVIKQLQKQSKEMRAAMQMDVRREVMAMPVYRAWSFLTGKRTADDTFDNPQPEKSSPDTMDETIDSLFVAIAKLGGINKDEAVGTWGIDPADKPTSGVFGKPVWRRDGGLSLDGMLETLAQYGYLELDENGKPDIREFEDKFKSELGGDAQYSTAYDYAGQQPVVPGKQLANPQGLTAGRLDLDSLAEIGLPVELVNHLKALRMTAKSGGLHADLVAEMFGFTSGDELTRTLAAAEAPKDVIEAMTDQRMLEQYGDLSSQEAIEKAADKAIHNDARARMVATELAMLEKAVGDRRTLASAAKEYAAVMIARLKVRNIKPGQYASAEVRAAKAAEQASKAGDIAKAAAEKRNQLVNTYATKAAYAAQDEIDAGLRYLKKFEGAMKGLDVGYQDQIANLLERFDLRKGQSLKAIDKRTALSSWLEAQREAGFEPDIPDDLVNEAYRTSYKNLTVEEFRGLVDTVKQIEHLGRLKKKLLTAKDQREYEVIRDEIATSIVLNADNRQADTRTPDTVLGKAMLKMRQFWASHIKSAMWARIMDGGKDGGPMWEYFIRSANERGDMETTMRAEATAKLSEILAPVFKSGKLTTKTYFPSIKRSLTREGRIAIALNWGNEGNRQRLMGGEGWTPAQVQPVLESLTADELRAVQAIWDHFESYRPEIGAKEKRVYGKEPDWVSPAPFIVSTADGQQITMRGGYYPIKYDPMASQRAEEHADAESAQRQLKGAYTTATTRRSFTKSRAEEVSGRPLLYSLAGVYSGVNDVIHDLAWHEWLIDTNRLLRSNTIDQAIRTHYGPAVKAQFKKWSEDIAEGDKASTDAGDIAVNYLRQSVSVAGLGFNVMSAAMQPLGITQSIVRVGAQWVGRGISKYIAHPVQLTREVNSMSGFMANRARTRNRELHELRNQVEGQTAVKEFVGKYAYFLIMRFQQAVDVPTWWGAYEKAVAEGNDDERAVALADQAVIDAQGGGMLKDQSGIERTDPKGKLFTVFYAFMNSALNLGVVTGMTEKSRAKQAANYALLYIIPPMLAFALKAAITPGDSGDDDPEKIAKKLLAAQIDYLMGMMVYVREFSDVAKTLAGANDLGRDYQGPAGLRLVADAGKFAHQVAQGEMDDALRKSFVNIMGDLFGLPSAQINRMITGSEALAEGKTDNPAAVVFGFQEKR